jgi:Uma2 family endonuclease
MSSRITLTYEDYAALPNDGKRYELHEGELSVTPAPGIPHQAVVVSLTVILGSHVRATRCGEIFVSPVDCIMSDITVVQPDLAYVDEARRSLLSERAIEGGPTMAIEVLSPSTSHIDRRTKMALYAKHDVTWYWIVDPRARTIDVHRLEAGSYRLDARMEGSTARALPPFPDLALDPAAIWP